MRLIFAAAVIAMTMMVANAQSATGSPPEPPACSEMEPYPCLNGGSCIDKTDLFMSQDGLKFYCSCPGGFSGVYCEINLSGSEEKRGMCPEVKMDTIGTCQHECDYDNSCTGMDKCCSNGCGKICTPPMSGCEVDGKMYAIGDIIEKKDPCMSCECILNEDKSTGREQCVAMSCALPECENPTYHEDMCCPVCDSKGAGG
ncbi:unnamed protein product, partial [Owenia fusiformis]